MTVNSHEIPLYHITHVDNLPNIIKSKGLWCDKEIVDKAFDYTNIAHANIKERRKKTSVPLYPGTTLDEYVPFYFCNRSPMLHSNHTGYVEGYLDGQVPIIYLVATIGRVIANENRWCFTDGHAVMAISEFYNKLADLSKIDWDLIGNWSWHDTMEDNDRKRRKQAEFLVEKFVPWNTFTKIGVNNSSIKSKVEKMLPLQSHQIGVNIESSWYY